jgi:2'-hydroxyisoflavone reductase
VTRREFVRSAALGLAACASPGAAGGPPPRDDASRQALRILVLGGTKFLGPDVVRAALARAHRVTLFNRGRTNPGLFPEVERLRGDRDGGLDALRGRTFDAVVDTSGYVPRIVRQSAELLAPGVERYLFVSSISAYAEPLPPGADEAAPLAELPAGAAGSEDVSAHYGALKAACERVVERALPERAVILRPGLIVGPGDPTDRFTSWPARMARGGEVLAPGDGRDPAQVVDVRDLGAFVVRLLEQKARGAFNAAGPARPLPMRELLEACRGAADTDAALIWVDAAFLEGQGVKPWEDLPVWVPRDGPDAGLMQVSAARAIARGLAFRPLADTARDTLAWWRTLPEDRRASPRAGLAAEREARLLAAWRARGGGPG